MSSAAESSETKRGLLIVFEGIDKSGKSSQSAALTHWFAQAGVEAVLYRFPDYNEAGGQLLKDYMEGRLTLSTEAAHMFFSANRWAAIDAIKKHLAAGVTVICDRYSYSGIAYSVAKGMSAEAARRTELGLPRPDMVFYFNITPLAVSQRPGFGDKHEKVEFLRTVRLAYEDLIDEQAGWVVVDAQESRDTVAASIIERVRPSLYYQDSARPLARIGDPILVL